MKKEIVLVFEKYNEKFLENVRQNFSVLQMNLKTR